MGSVTKLLTKNNVTVGHGEKKSQIVAKLLLKDLTEHLFGSQYMIEMKSDHQISHK